MSYVTKMEEQQVEFTFTEGSGFHALVEAVAALDKALWMLERRLAPVLVDDSGDPAPAEPRRAPMSALETQAVSVSAFVDRLVRLHNRVDV